MHNESEQHESAGACVLYRFAHKRGILYQGRQMDVFAISPATPRPLWFMAVICVILALVLIALAFTAWASRHSKVTITGDSIKLSGDFWGREIPMQQLDVAGARIVNVGKGESLSPKRRTFGTGIPGYSSGWFRLRNGEKALVYLTRRNDVVYIPTSDGYSLLLSIESPQRFIDTLKHHEL